MNREQILEAITASDLQHLRDDLAKTMMPSIRVISRAVGNRRSKLGSSRFGGLPDLVDGSEWPIVDGTHLPFIGQINLSDLPSCEAPTPLPSHGLLSFFFDDGLMNCEVGEAPKVRCRVIFTDTRDNPVRLAPPASRSAAFDLYPEAVATFELHWTLPEFEEIDGDEFPTFPAIVPLVRTMKDRENYHKLRSAVRGGKYIRTKLLGHADGVQGGEIRFDVVTRQDGGKRFRYENYEWTNRSKLVAEMRDLCLLLQAASGKGEAWNGPGVVYFWIRRQDLKRGRFDRCIASLQTT